MERLTNHFDYCKMIDCKFYDAELKKENKCKFFDLNIEHCHEKRINDKLREYEDLEEQGLLLRLPYNLATCGKLYYVDERDSEIYELTADKITISKAMITNEFVYEVDSLEFRFEDFGKIVFKTKAEAEKVLAEMG